MNIENNFPFKKCKCDEEYWEEIIVNNDDHYNYKMTIYYHCNCCGEDFAVLDFETGEILILLK